MNLINFLRTLFKIRVQRKLIAPGSMPPIGSSIVLDNLKIKLKHPINEEQWFWFSRHEWRVIDMRMNQRSYISVPDDVLLKLLSMNWSDREELHTRLIRAKPEEIHTLFSQTQDDET